MATALVVIPVVPRVIAPARINSDHFTQEFLAAPQTERYGQNPR
jgi:hypothetical protein